MGRKIDMKKIEDITKCQVTFSKRRSSLMKKANEISVCCEVDVAFVAFSPSGRVSKYCNQKRIEDVIHRYVNLPADRRLNHIQNVQEKMEKLRQLDKIKGDDSKLHFLDEQMKNLELQIKKSTFQLQILEADLRDYEPGTEQEPSLHQLSWCERNLVSSLQKVMDRKNALSNASADLQPDSQIGGINMEKQEGEPIIPHNFNADELTASGSNLTAGQLLKQLDPWISPYSAEFRDVMLQDILGQGKSRADVNHTTGMFDGGMPNTPHIGAPIMCQSEVMTIPDSQNSLNYMNDKGKGIIENDSEGIDNYISYLLGNQEDVPNSMNQFDTYAPVENFPGNTTQNFISEWSGFPQPSLKRPLFHGSSSASKRFQVSEGNYINPGIESEHVSSLSANFISGGSASQVGMGSGENNNTDDVGNTNDYLVDESFNNNVKDAQNDFQSPPALQANQPGEVSHPLVNNFPSEDILGDSAPWNSTIQKSSLWELDDIILNNNWD